MDKSIISMWGVPQCLKGIKERKVLKEVANAKWMRVICFIGPIVDVLLSSPHPPTPPPPPQSQPPPPPPPRRLMCGKYNTTLQMMSLVALQRCPLAAAELNYSTLGNKKGKILPLFIQRISKVARMLKSFQLSRARPPPLPAHPTYHCLRTGGGRSLIGLHFKHICHVSTNKFLQGRSADSKKQRFYQQLLCSLANVQNHSILKSADCNQSSFCTVTDRCRVLWWWVKVEHWSLRFVANNSTMSGRF